MKPFVAVGAILLVILNGLLLVPATVGHTFPIALVAFVIALLLLVFAILSRDSGTSRPAVRVATPAPPPAPIQRPAPVAKQSEAEIVAFFSLLQEKGRLIDFLMEDIARYEDAEVGAAARVIHQGCQQVIKEYFSISAISEAQEGAQVTVPAGYSPDQYRLVGKLTGNPPFTGTLLHKGWKTEFVKLPRIATTERLPSIAPAEVELK